MALGISRNLDAKNVNSVLRAIGDFKPDVVCVDPMAYQGVVAAEAAGVPWAAISPLIIAAADPSWNCPFTDAMLSLQPMIRKRMGEHGINDIRLHISDAVSPWLNCVFITEEFVPRSKSGNDFSWFVGPSKPMGSRGDETEFPWHDLKKDVPVIYVSDGGGQSLSFEPRLFVDICRSLSSNEAQFVCALQSQYGAALIQELPKSCIAVRRAPQLKLLEAHASAAVIHGGINSVSECLTYGRPMLVAPIGHEQFVQAQAVAAAGVGYGVDPSGLTPRICRDTLLRLVTPPPEMKLSIEKVRHSYRANGAIKAAKLIEALADSKKPQPPSSMEQN